MQARKSGRTLIVTGASSGLGFETSRQLAAHDGRVVMASRSQANGRALLLAAGVLPAVQIRQRAVRPRTGPAGAGGGDRCPLGTRHPGYSATNLQSSGPTGLGKQVMKVSNRLIAQSAEMGALDQLYAATDPAAESGKFYGPGGFMELRGYPAQVQPVAAAKR